jgi:hypothetical protein
MHASFDVQYTLAALARQHGLMVIKDCAEAFRGRGFRGSRGADISMFSFGSIKTSTALGGGLLTIRDPSLLRSVRSIEDNYLRQLTTSFLKRVVKYAVFKQELWILHPCYQKHFILSIVIGYARYGAEALIFSSTISLWRDLMLPMEERALPLYPLTYKTSQNDPEGLWKILCK